MHMTTQGKRRGALRQIEGTKWVRKLRTTAEQVRTGKLSPIMAAWEVLDAYASFVRSAFASPKRWAREVAESKRIWEARPWLRSPAAELDWWARSMLTKRGRRNKFFTSPELRQTIDAIMEADVARLRRLYGPPSWRWEP